MDGSPYNGSKGVCEALVDHGSRYLQGAATSAQSEHVPHLIAGLRADSYNGLNLLDAKIDARHSMKE